MARNRVKPPSEDGNNGEKRLWQWLLESAIGLALLWGCFCLPRHCHGVQDPPKQSRGAAAEYRSVYDSLEYLDSVYEVERANADSSQPQADEPMDKPSGSASVRGVKHSDSSPYNEDDEDNDWSEWEDYYEDGDRYEPDYNDYGNPDDWDDYDDYDD